MLRGESEGTPGRDDEIEAAAIAQLAPLLQRPEQLSRLQNFRADFQKQYEVAQSHLHSAVQAGNEDKRFAFEQINQLVALVTSCKENFDEIDHAGEDVKDLIREHKEILKYSIARKNMATTHRINEEFKNVGAKADALKKRLLAMQGKVRDKKVDRTITDVYKALRKLVLFRNQLWREGSKYASEFRSQVQRKFEVLNEVAEMLEGAVWDNLLDSISLSDEDPTTLVHTLKVIEWEDRSKHKVFPKWSVDMPYKEGKKGDGVMFAKALQRLGADIKATLDDVQKDMLEKPVAEQVELMEELVHELVIVYKRTRRCFPPRYNILSFYHKRYQHFLIEHVNELMSDTSKMSQNDTLVLADWIQNFTKKMSAIMGAAAVSAVDFADVLKRLAAAYKLKSQDTLTRPFENVVKQLQNDTPQEKENGAFFTFGPRDLYSIINRHFNSIGTRHETPDAVIEVAKLYGTLLNSCQRQMMEFLRSSELQEEKLFIGGSEKKEEFLCAWLSSGLRYEKNTDALHKSLTKKLLSVSSRAGAAGAARAAGPLRGGDSKRDDGDDDDDAMESFSARLDAVMDLTRKGFRRVADEVVEVLSSLVIALLRNGEAYKSLFSKAWYSKEENEEISENVIAEISESLVDYKTWSEWHEYNEKLTHSLLSAFVQSYFSSLLEKKPKVGPKLIQRLEADRRYYLRYVRSDPNFEGFQSKAEPAFRLFKGFVEIFQVQDAQEVDEHFTTILDACDADRGYLMLQQALKLMPKVSSREATHTLQRFKDFGVAYNERIGRETSDGKAAEAAAAGRTRIEDDSGFILDVGFPSNKGKYFAPKKLPSVASKVQKVSKLKNWFNTSVTRSNPGFGAALRGGLDPAEDSKEDAKADEEAINMEDFLGSDFEEEEG